MKYKEYRQYRLPNYNYADEGKYFITICTRQRGHDILSKVINDKVHLTEIGRIAESKWLNMPLRFKCVITDEYIIMPDHIHGIMTLKNIRFPLNDQAAVDHPENKFKSGIENNPMELNYFTLGRIIRDFKGSVKYEAAKNGFNNFSWQPKFYERIIRDDTELFFIQNYITDNPIYWGNEKYKSEEFFIRELMKSEKRKK